MIYLLQSLATLALWFDRNQTIQIKDHPDQHETNLLLGRHPSDAKINYYFLLCILLNLSISHYLDLRASIPLETGLILFEAWIIYKNKQLGLSIWK